jgi:predicted nucleic-acid-binding protein
MKALDTNVLVRFLVKDDEKQAKIAFQVITEAEFKQEALFVPLLVVLETVWVLQSVYEVPDQDIVSAFSGLMQMPVLKFESHQVMQNFISTARADSLDLSDLLIAYSAKISGCQNVLTFDKKASKFKLFQLLK